MSSTITVKEFAPLSLRGGVDLIDVRTLGEFYEVHAVGALCVPLDTLNPRTIMESRGARANDPLYIICRSGGRSQQACALFEDAGFPNVFSIEGGTLAWEQAGLPVNRGQKKMMSIERQVRIFAGLLTLTGALLATVSLWFLIVPALVGTLMTFAGLSNRCGMGLLLSKAPWNCSLKSGCGGGACGGCSLNSNGTNR
jgi:rhodanese-related sulfurtransferase